MEKINPFLFGKDISKIKTEKGNVYYRIFHYIGSLLTEMTVFELEKDIETNEETLTEIQVMDLSEEDRDFLLSALGEKLSRDEWVLMSEVFRYKYQLFYDLVKKQANRGTERRLLQFIEAGGLYFALMYEKGALYPKIYQCTIDFVHQEVWLKHTPIELLPAILEGLLPVLFTTQSTFITQIDEGVFAYIEKANEDLAIATIILGEENQEGGKMSVDGAFAMKRVGDEWLSYVLLEEEKEFVQQVIERSFHRFFEDISKKIDII